MSPDGKPIQVNASSLHSAAAQNIAGRSSMLKQKDVFLKPRIDSKNNINFFSKCMVILIFMFFPGLSQVK